MKLFTRRFRGDVADTAANATGTGEAHWLDGPRTCETFLRLLVEAELRRLTEQLGDLAVQAGCITRVIRVARVLTAVRALGDDVAGQVLDDFELALDRWQAWPPGRYGRGLLWLTRSAAARSW